MNSKTLLSELKRRNVFRVAAVYAVSGWLLIQAAWTLLPTSEVSSWTIKVLVLLLTLGFALAVFISWAFEATPEGMKRTENVSPEEILPSWSRRKFAVLIITLALFAASLLVYDLLRRKPVLPPVNATPGLTNDK